MTGASGFLGSHLCRALTAEGHPVRAFHRAGSNLAGLEGLPVEHWVGDVLEPASLAPAMRGVEAVFHTAAPMRAGKNAQAIVAGHVQGTRNVLEAAGAAGVRRLIHTSSVAALGIPDATPAGDPPSTGWMDETHTWNYRPERWLYSYAKHLSELEVLAAVERGLDAVIVNPSAVFGAGDWNRIDLSLVTHVARGRLVPIIPGGLNVVHIRDVTAGHLAAWRHGRRGERYILGGENLTLERVIGTAAEVTGRPPPRLRLPAAAVRLLRVFLQPLQRRLRLPIDVTLLWLAGLHFYYDTTKARLELHLDEPLSYRQAVQETYTWLKSIGAV